MPEAIAVECRPEGDGWSCRVAVGDDPGRTEHLVTVSAADLQRLVPDATDPTELVRASFTFLLAREGRGSILRRFELPVIGRYFPEYESEIGAAMAAGDGESTVSVGP